MKDVKYDKGNFFTEGGAAHSSNRHDWGTPKELFNELDKEFNFTLDVCAVSWNAKCQNYFSPEDDGLSSSWRGHTCFMNPPFGRAIRDWIEKAYTEHIKYGITVVAVIPARTDTTYWHDFIEGKAEVRFIKGRLKYETPNGPKDPAPFPSCIVVWRESKGL